MTPEKKQAADARILRRVTGLREYASCGTVLTYVSKPIEVDTIALIERALADGKRVAAPRCVEGRREMEFFLIHSLRTSLRRPSACSSLSVNAACFWRTLRAASVLSRRLPMTAAAIVSVMGQGTMTGSCRNIQVQKSA